MLSGLSDRTMDAGKGEAKKIKVKDRQSSNHREARRNELAIPKNRKERHTWQKLKKVFKNKCTPHVAESPKAVQVKSQVSFYCHFLHMHRSYKEIPC